MRGRSFGVNLVTTALLTMTAWAAPRPSTAAPRACNQFQFETVEVTGASAAIPQSINDRGDLVGVAFDVAASAWMRTDDVITTFALGEPGTAEMNSINNSGLVIGDYFGADGKLHGFTFEDGVFSDLDYPGASRCRLA
jgi:probable HAF family extracellular repeat protein